MKSGLAESFRPLEHYASSTSYSLLPFRFLRLDRDREVLTNLAGQHLVMPASTVQALVHRTLRPDTPHFRDLEAGHFLARGLVDLHAELLAAQIRTRRARLPDFTALHIFVVTLRCDHSCSYCQVSRVSEDRMSFDMSEDIADRAIALMLRSPSQQLKVEFQGGESLLNFPLVRHIVRRTRELAPDRNLQFVIATNLAFLTDEMLDFCADHGIGLSTSLDGPPDLHNANRPRPGKDAYERTITGIRRARERLGLDEVSALMTCTAASLEQPEAIIDEYVRQGFREIFLRYISPYGFALKSAVRTGYDTERFLEFYRRGLAHILHLNREGVPLRETYASILLRRMLTPFPTGYVDLQSPAGAGLSVMVYNYDGDVYASDEGRMLAAMGDITFRLGNVMRETWEDLFLNSSLLDTADRTMTESMPGCSECAFQPWCGSDPTFHYATQGDAVGHRPTSAFCRRNMEIMRHLVLLLEDDPVAARILRHWAK